MKPLLTLILLLLIVLPAFAQDDEEFPDLNLLTIAELETLAEKLTEKREYSDAERVLRRLLSLNPKNPKLLTDLGYLLIKNFDSKDAVPILKEAIQFGATDGRAEVALAHLLREPKRDEFLEEAIKKKTDIAFVYKLGIKSRLGVFQQLWFKAGDYTNAMDELDQAIEIAESCARICSEKETTKFWPSKLKRLKRFYNSQIGVHPGLSDPFPKGCQKAEVFWIPKPKADKSLIRLHARGSGRFLLFIEPNGELSFKATITSFFRRYEKEVKDALENALVIPKLCDGKAVRSRKTFELPFYYGHWDEPRVLMFQTENPFEY